MRRCLDDGAALAGACGEAAAPLLFYGASGYTLAMALVLRHAFAPALAARAIGFVDDEVGGRGAGLAGAPVLSFDQARGLLRDAPFLVGIGDPGGRARLVERVRRAGGRFLRFYDDRPASLFPGVAIGEGGFVGPNTYLGPRTAIGAHAQVMSNCSIGHDVEIGAFCTVCPSCTISGHVVLGEGVYLGAGTTVVNGTAAAPLRIGAGAKLWAGSVVLRDVAPGATLAGNPAASPRALVAAIAPRESGRALPGRR